MGAVLGREVLSLHRALDGADITVDGVLGPGVLALIGEAFSALNERADALGGGRADLRTAGTSEGPAEGWPWPMAVEPHWDAVRTDGVWHAVYWIAEWPRVEVTPDFLGPLLFAPLRRSLSLVMEPVGPVRAAREVAQSRTADLADGELRRRGGFLVTARHTRERESVEERDVGARRRPRPVPLLGVRDGDRHGREELTDRVRRRGAGRRPGAGRAPPPLRGTGRRLHLLASAPDWAGLS